MLRVGKEIEEEEGHVDEGKGKGRRGRGKESMWEEGGREGEERAYVGAVRATSFQSLVKE